MSPAHGSNACGRIRKLGINLRLSRGAFTAIEFGLAPSAFLGLACCTSHQAVEQTSDSAANVKGACSLRALKSELPPKTSAEATRPLLRWWNEHKLIFLCHFWHGTPLSGLQPWWKRVI